MRTRDPRWLRNERSPKRKQQATPEPFSTDDIRRTPRFSSRASLKQASMTALIIQSPARDQGFVGVHGDLPAVASKAARRTPELGLNPKWRAHPDERNHLDRAALSANPVRARNAAKRPLRAAFQHDFSAALRKIIDEFAPRMARGNSRSR